MIFIDDILKLSAAKKILLIEKVWDNINPNEITIPEDHIAETRRRIDALRKERFLYQVGKKFGKEFILLNDEAAIF